MFQEVDAINRELQDDEATYALFKTVYATDKRLARQCYFIVEARLTEKGEYQLCLSCIGDPQARFNLIRQGFEADQANVKRLAEQRQELARQTTESGPKDGSPKAWFPPDTSEMLKKNADDRFVRSVGQLVEILVGTGHRSEAEEIRDQAASILDDPRVKSAVDDAEKKVRK